MSYKKIYPSCVFSFSCSVLWCTKGFNFNDILFYSSIACAWNIMCKDNTAETNITKVYTYVFFEEFYSFNS